MSEQCHICGPVKHEAPTVICAPCALQHERSRLAHQRLEALIPLADALREINRLNHEAFKPFVFIPPLGTSYGGRR